MQIRSASFVKGIVKADAVLEDGIPQIAFIGRSNVGKSSTINALTKQNHLAKTSSFPGRTQEINIFLINKTFYLVDLPGYGFAKAPKKTQQDLQALIDWYLFNSNYQQTAVVLIIDAAIGITAADLEMLQALEMHHKNIIVAANKIDKIKPAAYQQQINTIKELAVGHAVIPYSTKKGLGVGALAEAILNKNKF
ncbi:MAG: ribosome biogenesis GTP-binding protein YihA/YsxC [Patescibacteria group bacterium]|jgi:GTP-binding protein